MNGLLNAASFAYESPNPVIHKKSIGGLVLMSRSVHRPSKWVRVRLKPLKYIKKIMIQTQSNSFKFFRTWLNPFWSGPSM